jgi:hypothetical protein
MAEDKQPAGLKERWLAYVRQQTIKTAADPMARPKLLAMITILVIICYNLPKTEATGLTCGPCVTWAAQFCTGLIVAGGACASVALFPPALCACLLAAGGAGCAAAATTCAVICAVV